MKKIYLDYAATTPIDERVLEAMNAYFTDKFGNPGSLHSFGQEAIAAVDKSRETITGAIGAKFEEIVFTGSATEANNLALRGVVKNFNFLPLKIIVSSIEHESVLETARDLEEEDVEVVYLPVSREGFVDLEGLKSSLDERTVLVSIMYANNEVGVIQPVAEISKIVKGFNSKILVHADAVQAFQYLDCDVDELGVDLMTLSAHKIYGPKGVGALYVRNLEPETQKSLPSRQVDPLITGGGQEFGLRSGTENIPGIVGFARAIELISKHIPVDPTRDKRELENERIKELRDYFWKGLKKIYPSADTNPEEVALGYNLGYNLGQPKYLPNILNVYFPDHLAEDLLIKLDMAGVAVSSSSACRARSTKPSHVLEALGLPTKRIKNSIRFSLGRFTDRQEIKEALERIKKVFEDVRNVSL
ncbi:MAG: cysteine desulfurase [Patescibacteria group bacterium]|nr:cysteine desulfurase [Patescibacteria group bacterium]